MSRLRPAPPIALSVLVCSTHTRHRTFGREIQEQLWPQYLALPLESQDRVEVLMLTDNKKMMLGAKRNIMVDMAQGRYVVFVDDDDRIEPDYLSSLLEATDSGADVITFLVSVRLNGGPAKICRYSKQFQRDRNTADGYERLPNHICCVRRDLAQLVSFPNVVKGEDSAYSKLLRPNLQTEHAIPRVLYHYDYDDETTEAQPPLRAALRTRHQPPIVDVVILSKAAVPELGRMTQTAIDTCLAGANSLPVNIIVVEQGQWTYRHAAVIRPDGDFNYNAFANLGAGRGTAEWIMVANNDLIFRDGWLHALLAANHPVVSPKCPRDPRQAGFVENTTGFFTARHFSGWCYMMRRELWRRIGGLDDCVDFWCSDDVVIEQVRAAGVAPMLVPASLVEHLQSVTLRTRPNHDELTWRNIAIFNRKYGRHRLADDPRFREWEQLQPR